MIKNYDKKDKYIIKTNDDKKNENDLIEVGIIKQ